MQPAVRSLQLGVPAPANSFHAKVFFFSRYFNMVLRPYLDSLAALLKKDSFAANS
jgi:hypothetical protein